VEVEDEVEVGPVAATPAGVLVVEEVSADVGEGVGAAAGDTAGGFAVDVGALRQAQGGGQQLPGLGTQIALEPPPAGQRR
jgi:hypothetical protein